MIAASLYYRIVFCPYFDQLIVQFYENLMTNFPLETILKTLARVLLVAKAVFSTLIGRAPRRLGSHWSRASECCLHQQIYAIKNQRGASNGGILRSKAPKY